MNSYEYAPDGYSRENDALLPELAADLTRLLSAAQGEYASPTLNLGDEPLQIIAEILVDFAFDIHCCTGMWDAYERCNHELFGAPLPLTAPYATDCGPTGIHIHRVQHLLWVICSELLDEQVIAPNDHALTHMAHVAHEFLAGKIPQMPMDSGVKEFLAAPNTYGWDVKKKLGWLGMQSFLFRLFHWSYMARECGGQDTIENTDDFLCQECTRLSGLGVIDLLAYVLELKEDERRDLLRWRYRHLAPFKVLSSNKQVIRVQNVITNKQYLVRMNAQRKLFKTGQLAIGSLVPYRGEWYWSGSQRTYNHPTKAFIADLKHEWGRKMPHVVCRYDDEYEQKVRKVMDEVHAGALAFYGTDLEVYPDGLSMAVDWEKEARNINESKPEALLKEVIQKHGLRKGLPNISLPKDLLESSEGIGVFLNPDEGKEIMEGFDFLVSGLRRNGRNLTDDEQEAIRGFIRSDSISPAFVKRVVAEYGDESLKAAFKLTACDLDCWLEYLLRSYKGAHYRKRCPAISLA